MSKRTLINLVTKERGNVEIWDRREGRVHVEFVSSAAERGDDGGGAAELENEGGAVDRGPIATIRRVGDNGKYIRGISRGGERSLNESLLTWLSMVDGNVWPYVCRMGTLSGILYALDKIQIDGEDQQSSETEEYAKIITADVKRRIGRITKVEGIEVQYSLSNMGFSQVLKSNTGLKVSPDGSTCSSTTSIHTSCYVSPPLPLTPQGSPPTSSSYTFLITQDVSNDESCCVGLGTLPRASDSYNSSGNLCMYRCYNGNVYVRGNQVRGTSREKVHPGDLVEIEVEGVKATVKVNGNNQGEVFGDLDVEKAVFPAVAFYGGNRTIKFVKCYMGNGTGVENLEPGKGKHALGGDIVRWYGGIKNGRMEGMGVCVCGGWKEGDEREA